MSGFDDEPLQTFIFGGDASATFVLVQGQPVVYALDLRPPYTGRDSALHLLVPCQLDSDIGESFARIVLDRYPFRLDFRLVLDENVDEETILALRELVETLPGTVDTSYEVFWAIDGVTIRVADDGVLEVVACDLP